MLKVGDEVKWMSQSAGVLREKHGVVVEVVPPGKLPTKLNPRKVGRPRDQVSYLVRAQAVIDKVNTHARNYWPKTLHLKKATSVPTP